MHPGHGILAQLRKHTSFRLGSPNDQEVVPRLGETNATKGVPDMSETATQLIATARNAGIMLWVERGALKLYKLYIMIIV